MGYSHLLLTRPLAQSQELAAMLEPLGLETVIQPAFSFSPLQVKDAQRDDFTALSGASPSDMVVFTSPRAVAHGLPQLPPGVLSRVRVAAIGPTTAKELAAAGIRTGVQPAGGYTSEALLETLGSKPASPGRPRAFIMTAPGGRKKLAGGLSERGWDVRTLMVYRSEPVPLDRQSLTALDQAGGILSVWTSGNTMRALSQRLPARTWFQVCQGDWLVISERLKRLARAYGPPGIHRAAGPDNASIATAVRNLC